MCKISNELVGNLHKITQGHDEDSIRFSWGGGGYLFSSFLTKTYVVGSQKELSL